MTQPPRVKELLIGFLSIWPAFYFISFLLFVAYAITNASEMNADLVHELFPYFMPIHIGTALLTMLLLIVHVVHVFRNEHLSQDKKVLWLLVLFMGHAAALPAYWYAHMWRRKTSSTTAQVAAV